MASPSSPPQPRGSCAQAVAEDEPPRDRGQVPSATDNQPRSMERDYDFVERPSQDFFCPVSLELLLEPQQLSCCGNHLSRETATRLQREGKPCPMCNEQEWQSMVDKYHRRKVREVRLRCPHKGSGCDWVGEVNELTRHTDSCAKRPWECKYCGLKCTYGEGEGKHWPTCRKFPEPCPNGCEVGSVERCNVEQHRSVCSLEPVACEMKEFGCCAVVPRKELATHMRESELQHLTAMAVLNLRLSRQLQQDSTERDRKITRLQQDMAEQNQLQVEMKKEMGEEIMGLKEGQKREGSQVKDAIAALSQQVEREKETMTELLTKTREEMKKETKQLQTEMKTKMDEQKKMQTEMKTKMDEQKKMQTEMKAKMDEQKKMQTEMKTKMDEQKKMQTEMKTKMYEQEREVVELKAQMQAVQHTTQHIEEHTTGSCSHIDGVCSVSKVLTFTQFAHFKGSRYNEVISDTFYSHHHGYKFKLRIIYAPDNHACLYLYLVTGEYDDQLHWPVEVKVRLQLLNQAGNHHHVEKIKATSKWKKNDRDSYRLSDVIKYSELEMKGDGVKYIMNDCFKFGVHVIVSQSD